MADLFLFGLLFSILLGLAYASAGDLPDTKAAVAAAKLEAKNKLAALEEQSKRDAQALAQLDAASKNKVAALTAEKNEMGARLNDLLNETNRLKALIARAQTALDDKAIRDLKTQLPAALFGVKSKMNKVVFVVDTSGSMINPWEECSAAIGNWFNLLPIENVALVAFGTNVTIYQKPNEWLPVQNDAQRAVLAATVKSFKPQGDTNTLDALKIAMAYNDADAIVLFSDGEPNLNGKDVEQQIKAIETFVAGQPQTKPIICVAIGNYQRESRFSAFMIHLATMTKGTFIGR